MLCLYLTWTKPRRSLIEVFQRIAESALEVGNIELAYPALHNHMAYAAFGGESLPSILRRIEVLARSSVPRGHLVPPEAYERAWRLLHEPAHQPIDWQRESEQIEALTRHSNSANLLMGVQWVAVLCILGRFADARTTSARLSVRILNAGALGSTVADYVFFRGLAHAVGAEECGSLLERRRHRRTLRLCLRKLRTWQQLGTDLVHMWQLLAAESSRLQGRRAAALRQYQDAAQQARKVGYVHHAALCHERRSSLLERMRRDTEAESALSAAAELYREWGAQAKVRQLKGRAQVV